MDPRLQHAIEHDDVDELHRLIVEEPKLLDRACKGPFPNTPLHVAAAAGKTKVAIEMAIMMPSFVRKLNPEGYSPLHLALQHQRYQTARTLVKFNPKLIRVRGRHGITSLHYLAEKEGDDELELLAEFLTECKSSIEDLTSRCDTAVHHAIRNHNHKAFKVLCGWLKRVSLIKVLDRKDQDGNTVLHIAASEQQPEIVKLLIGYANVDVKNFQDKTVLEIFLANPGADQDVAKSLRRQGFLVRILGSTLSLSQLYSSKLSAYEKLTVIFRLQPESSWYIFLTLYIVCVALSFQVALIPLRGYWQDSSLNPLANSTVVTANSSIVASAEPHPAQSWIPDEAIWVLSITIFIVSMCELWLITMGQLPYARKIFWAMAFLVLACSIDGSSQELIEVAGFSFKRFISGHPSSGLVSLLVRVGKYNRVLDRIDATKRLTGNILRSKNQKIC